MLNSASRKLKTYFIFFASSIVLASIILMYFFYTIQRNQSNTISFIRNLKEISVNLKQLNNASQNYKNINHSDDFYIYKHDAYSDKIYFFLNLLKNNTESLNKQTSVINFDISVKFNEIKDLFTDFETDFELLNENIVKLGNSGNGYTENIIRTEQKTDKILKTYPQLYNHFQKLKKTKTNLLSIGNRESEEQFLKEKKAFLQNIKQNQSIFENTSEKQIVINNTADWINTVLQFFKLQKINGTSYYSGLYDKLDDLVFESENNIADIQDIVLTELTDKNRRFLINYILFTILFIIVFIVIVFFIYDFIKKQLKHTNNELSELVLLNEKDNINISEFEKTKRLIHQLKKDTEIKTKFINSLKSNKLIEIEGEFNSDDKLGNALNNLRNFLISKDDERKKDEQIKAISDKHKDGIVKFGKIIRQQFGNLDNLTFNLLSELVHFLHADIGGIYVVDKKENSDLLKLKASYAYDEKKIINKEIKIGEGLVGTCAADKSSVYIDRVDDDYIKIVSGFGHTKPKSLLLSPIFVEEEIYGVIELASSGTFSEDDITFVETLSEDIAYTLSYLLK